MEIGAVPPISPMLGVGDPFARKEIPLDTRRTDARSATRLDTFRPSLRTPLDADRLLGTGRESSDGTGTKAAGESGAAGTGSAANAAGMTESDTRADGKGKDGTRSGNGTPNALSEEQKREVDRLKQRDVEVRAHEQAHLAAAGGLAKGGATFDYETGPDGKRYAVGGEVQIAMKSGRTPEETIRNAERVRAAALAPADPSSVDQQTAAAASRMAQEARQQSPDDGSGAANSASKDAQSPATPPGGTGADKAKTPSSPVPTTPDTPKVSIPAGAMSLECEPEAVRRRG